MKQRTGRPAQGQQEAGRSGGLKHCTGARRIRNRYASTPPALAGASGQGSRARQPNSVAVVFSRRAICCLRAATSAGGAAQAGARLSRLASVGQRVRAVARCCATREQAEAVGSDDAASIGPRMAVLPTRNGSGGRRIAMPCRRRQIGVARGTLNAGRRWIWQPEEA